MSQDETLLLDILQAASDAFEFVATLDQAQFNASKFHQNAVIRCIEIIGEAAGKVSQEFQDAHLEIPWRDITGMRHRLIHNYADIRLDLVWDVSQNKLPELIAAIRPLIPPSPADTKHQ